MKVADVLREVERLAPAGTAEDWDNVGLLVGDPDWETLGAVVSIDLTAETLNLARQNGYRLIVNHHPCIFPRNRGLGRVVPGSPVYDALREGIAVISCHTNFDRSAMEVVQTVSEGLGVKPQGRLLDSPQGSLVKLSVFVPESHLQAVRDAVCAAGAGQVGNYDTCTFSAPGEGTFRGGEASKPFIGKPGQLETAREVRLETILPRGLEAPVVAALRAAHPYEEVAYDLYAVEQSPPRSGLVRGLGYGFWGDFPRPKPFSEVAKDVKCLFNIDGFWLTEPAPPEVARVAYVAGKGASFVSMAASIGCDLFITGEAGYHTVLDAARRGMAVMEIGHRESELFFMKTMNGWLTRLGLAVKTSTQATQRLRIG